MKAMIVAFDRLSAWSLGCYGNGEVRTPYSDRFAAESVVFDQHFGENFDPTARHHAWWTGCHQFPRTPEQQSACTHVVDVLRAAGVETWMMRAPSRTRPVPGESRFDHVIELNAASAGEAFRLQCRDAINTWASDPQMSGLLWWQDPGLSSPGQGRTVAIDVAGIEPGESLSTVPAGGDSVEMLDRRLGMVLDLLNGMEVEDLLTIVTAAAGSLVEDRSKFLSGERPLAEEQVHTPLLIRDSDVEDSGNHRQSLVQTIDLPPTLLDWFGLADRLPRCDGNSLLPLLRGEATTVHECLFLGDGQGNAAIRTPDWYLTDRMQGRGQATFVESSLASPSTADGSLFCEGRLFSKPGDVWDIQDIAAQVPRETARLRESLEKFLTGFGSVSE